MLQSAAVHELHPLAELAFFKSVPVGHAEMFFQYFEGGDPINAVDGGKEVVRILEMGLVLQKGSQVEVVLREYDAHRLNAAFERLVCSYV